MTRREMGMALVDALQTVRQVRRDDEIVISTMAAAREWMALGALHPLDWVFVPSSMGQAVSLGLGLALACPDRRVIVLNGDGSLLMNLGSLVTITSLAPTNLVQVLLDNGVYEVTGAQPTPGSSGGRRGEDHVDFAAVARACGFQSVFHFTELDRWRERVRSMLDVPGPTFAVLDVAPVPEGRGPRSPGFAPDRARAFMAALRDQR